MKKFTKLMLTLALLVVGVTGAKAAWEEVYSVDYSQYTGFPFYVMGYVPEFVDGVMTDYGAAYRYATQDVLDNGDSNGNGKLAAGESVQGSAMAGNIEYKKVTGAGPYWHQYFIADGIQTQIGGKYTVKAMVRASQNVSFQVNMGWGWGNGESIAAGITADTEWKEVTWQYDGVGGTSCNLVAQPGGSNATIEWKYVKVGYEGTTVWKDIIVNGDMEGESAECFYISEQGVGGPFIAPLTAGVGKNGSKAVKVESYNDPTNNWDTQFFIRLPYQLPAGTSYKVSFDYKATKAGDFETQSHAEPGQYIHWACIGSGSFTTEWKTYEHSGTIPNECDGSQNSNGYLNNFQTVAFNLSLNKVATKFFIDNVKFEVTEDVFKDLTANPAVNPKQYPAKITSMVITGFDGSWDPADEDWKMIQDADDDAVWTLDKEYTATATGKHEYKATANGNWDRYVLPAGDNAEYTFAATGKYILHFTVNTKKHSLILNVERVPDKVVIVGDFLGQEDETADFNPANGWAMTKDATNSVVWTLTKDFTAAAKTYRFKAVGNDSYDYYQLPESGNEEFEFGTTEYPVGNYELTFTVNTKENTLGLAAVKKADTYTVAGSSALFGSDWDVTDANNELTQNNDGTYSITYTDVPLTGDVEYKVVMDHGYAYGSWPAENRVIGINMAGTYDITINFNPADGSVWETMAVAKKLPEAGEGYATFCAPYDINFEGTGVQAYFAKFENGLVNFYEISNAPKNTGLLLKADVDTYKLKMETITGEAAANVDGNVLIGVNEETVVNKSGIFVLLNSDKGVGFYKTTAESFTVGANTAYIDINDTARDFIGFDFNGSTTAIEGVATVKENNGEIYNLAGQRVAQPTKGLYIVNGKKVVIK